MKIQFLEYLKRKNLMLLISSFVIFLVGLSMFCVIKVIITKGASAAISTMTLQTEEVNDKMQSCLRPSSDALNIIKKWSLNSLIEEDTSDTLSLLIIPLLSQYSQINGCVISDSSQRLVAFVRKNDDIWLGYRIFGMKNGDREFYETVEFDNSGRKLKSSVETLPDYYKRDFAFPDEELTFFEAGIDWEVLKDDPIFKEKHLSFATQWKIGEKVIKASVNFCLDNVIKQFETMPFSEYFQIFMISVKGEGVNIFSGSKLSETIDEKSAQAIVSDLKTRGSSLSAPVRMPELGLLYYIKPFSGDSSMYIGIVLFEQKMRENPANNLSLFTTLSFIVAGLGIAMFFSVLVIHRREEDMVKFASVPSSEKDWKRLIASGEGDSLEFKSSLRWDMEAGVKNTKLEDVILKTVGAFGNAKGGTLIIGVDDSGTPLGLEKDYATMNRGNKDGFELHLRELLNNSYGIDFTAKHVKVEFPIVSGKELCAVSVSPSDSPLYTKVIDPKRGKIEKFYIRNGNSSKEIEQISDIAKYILSHFKKRKK